jgi:hypothetical protein
MDTDSQELQTAYFIAGHPGFTNYDQIDGSVIIETLVGSDAYNQCIQDQNINGLEITAGPFPYIYHAQAAAPNAIVVSEMEMNNGNNETVNVPGIAKAVPIALFVAGIVLIAITHGKIGNK